MTRRRAVLRAFRHRTVPPVESRSVALEFLGLPASGKTTVARLLTAHLAAQGFATGNMAVGRHGYTLAPVTSGEPRGQARLQQRTNALDKARLAWRHRSLVGTVVRVLAGSSRGLQHRLFTLRRVLTTLGRWEAVASHQRNHDLAIFEEGLLQHAFLVFIDDRGRWDRHLLSRYVTHAARADLVVHLTLAPAESLRRQLRRQDAAQGESVSISRRFRSLDHSSLEEVLASGDRLLRSIAQRVSLDDDGRVVTLDATESAENLAAVLAETVLPLLTDGDRNVRG